MVDALKQQLLSQAYLFDDPRAYAAGIHDALDAVESFLEAAEEARTA